MSSCVELSDMDKSVLRISSADISSTLPGKDADCRVGGSKGTADSEFEAFACKRTGRSSRPLAWGISGRGWSMRFPAFASPACSIVEENRCLRLQVFFLFSKKKKD
jgi:hypothetical protein